MRLTELRPRLLRCDLGEGTQVHVHVDTLAEAHGLSFDCPCLDGAKVRVFFTHAPPEAMPRPNRWAVSGTGLADLSLSPSIKRTHACGAHFVVQGGAIGWCE